jgi:hypothetical protein
MAKSLTVCILILLTLSSIALLNPIQAQSTNKLSGYVLDTNGSGINGALITLNQDTITPVLTNNIGYYEVYAPANTYQVTVYPPFDSSYLFYNQLGLSLVISNSQNFTLNNGYKISGYIKDQTGAVVPQARFALMGSATYVPGWYSNMSGYYFATAPAGTYTLTADHRTGVWFNSYSEPNIVLKSNIIKNITVSTQTTTPTPTPSPTPQPTLQPTANPIIQTATPTPNPTKTSTPTTTSTPTPSSILSSIQVTKPDGASQAIGLFGNITSQQITAATFATNESLHKATVNFSVTGQTGNVGFANLTIPKSFVDNGIAPVVYIDSVAVQNQGYTQDESNYFVWFTTHFSMHEVSIEFTTTSPIQGYNVSLLAVLLLIVIALPVIAFIVVIRKRRKEKK